MRIGAPGAPQAAAYADRATAPAGVQPANPDAADGAIDQDSQFAKLVHALPRLCHRTVPESLEIGKPHLLGTLRGRHGRRLILAATAVSDRDGVK